VETKGAVLGWRRLLLDRWVRATSHAFIVPAAHLRGCLRLKDHAERAISDGLFEKRSERWPEETPDTKEACFIRDLFDSEFFSAFRRARLLTTLFERFVPLGDCSENGRSVRITFS
jgi:hypothetical protein